MSGAVPQDVVERMVAIRRDLHRYPELSWQEHRSAEQVTAVLDSLEIPHRRLLETGVVADLPGPEEVPRVALRADLDALPIREETGLEFASQRPGVMHACGHDGHTSMLLGAAHLLARDRELAAPVRLLFQPAEEKGAGAKAMIEAGALDGVGMIFGGHLDVYYPPGTLVVTDGVVAASTDSFRIRLRGRGAHAARPHESVDAVVAASHLVVALQTVVSRQIDPARPAVVTVGTLEAGSAANIIAAEAQLTGTLRAQDPAVRARLQEAVSRLAESTATAHGAEADVAIDDGTPPLENSPEATRLARQAAIQVAGADSVASLEQPNMAAEDFACYLEQVPGCYIRFGARLAGGGGFSTHSNRFDFDERALAVGAAWFHRVAHLAGKDLQTRRS